MPQVEVLVKLYANDETDWINKMNAELGALYLEGWKIYKLDHSTSGTFGGMNILIVVVLEK